MKILVIDDKEFNRELAKAQFENHDVTVIGSYDGGRELLKTNHEFEAVLVDLLMPASGEAQVEDSMHLVGQEMPIGIFLALLAAKNGAKYVAVFTDSSHHYHPASACFDVFNEREEKPTPFVVGSAKFILCNNRDWMESMLPSTEKEAKNLYARYSKRHKELKGKVGGDKEADEAWGAYVDFEKKQPKGKAWDMLLEYLIATP